MEEVVLVIFVMLNKSFRLRECILAVIDHVNIGTELTKDKRE